MNKRPAKTPGSRSGRNRGGLRAVARGETGGVAWALAWGDRARAGRLPGRDKREIAQNAILKGGGAFYYYIKTQFKFTHCFTYVDHIAIHQSKRILLWRESIQESLDFRVYVMNT